MSKQRNVNDGDIPDILRRLYRLERQAMLAHSAIGRDGLEVYDGGWIRILNGGLQVIGTATISGTLDVTGTTNLKGQTSVTGPMEISGTTNITGNTNIMGELNVTGPTTLDGETEIGGDTTVSGALEVTGAMSTKGTLSVEGVTTLKNDLNVTEGGKIKAGALEIEPANGGQINFTGGSLSASANFGALLNNSKAVVLQGPVVELKAPTVNISTLPSKPASELTPIGIDSAGRLHLISQGQI